MTPEIHKNHKIKATTWWTTCQPTPFLESLSLGIIIGAVLVESEPGLWKSYIGVGRGEDSNQDANNVYAYGAKLLPHIARQVFHNFPDIEKLVFSDEQLYD